VLDETFAEAICSAPASPLARALGFSGHKILGQRLRPFSFWHAANLDFIQSPFAGHPGNLGFASLYLAAKCCQLRYPRTIAQIPPRRSRRARSPSTQNLRFPSWNFVSFVVDIFKYRYARRFETDTGFRLNQITAFSAYLADYMTCGPIVAEREGSKPVKIPWYLYYAAMLVKHAGYGKEQAWNSPVAESQWWVTALMIAGGTEIDIMSASDRAQLREIGYKEF
jgi:hypothetical protein